MKRLYILSFLLGLGLQINAQQQASFTNFLVNDYYYNPAIAGSKNVHVASFSYRNQWAGFDGAPITMMGNFYGSYKNKGVNGYGASIVSDKTGLTQRTGLYLNYAQHIKLSKKVKLGLGIQPGYVQYRVRLYDAQLADEGDEVLSGNVFGANAVDVNAGLHLYSDKFFFMASGNQLLGDQVKFTSYNPGLSIHYTAIGGYNIQAGKKAVIQPSFMLKHTEPTPLQWNAMIKTTMNKKLWFGLSYRSDDAASICLGYTLKERFTFGYAFDYSLSGINNYQSGSHEIVLSFVLTKNKPNLDQKDEEINNSIMKQLKDKHSKEEEEK